MSSLIRAPPSPSSGGPFASIRRSRRSRRSFKSLALFDAFKKNKSKSIQGSSTTTTVLEEQTPPAAAASTTASEEVTSTSSAKHHHFSNPAVIPTPENASAFAQTIATPLSRDNEPDDFLLAMVPGWKHVPRGSAVVIDVTGALSDKPRTRFQKNSQPISLPEVSLALKMAAKDPRITGVVLQVEGVAAGWAKLTELRRCIQLVRDAGKFTVAYLEAGGEREYYVAAACEEVVCPPSAYVSLTGLSVSGTFLGGVLEKVGVEPQVQRIGKYKSAGDQIMRKDMSDAQREVLGNLVGNIYSVWSRDVCESRGKPREDIENLLSSGLTTAAQLQEAGWIDRIAYKEEVRQIVASRTAGRPWEMRAVSATKYLRTKPSAVGINSGKPTKAEIELMKAEAETASDKDADEKKGKEKNAANMPATVAVIRASGGISRGSTKSGPSIPGRSSDDGIKSGDVIRVLRQVRRDKSIKAVVLRVDSPGGDALASDLMWREIRSLRRVKPVVASMGDLAASGGYYMSMACEKIFAYPLTLTGSIGVVTGKFNLASLYDRIGYGKETLSIGRFAQVGSDERSFTDEEREYFEKNAGRSYASFRDKAAESRGMSIKEMEKLAQGRVWTGAEALSKGLVDAIGGIEEAAQEAASLAGFRSKVEGEPANVRLVEYNFGGGRGGGGASDPLMASMGATFGLLANPKAALSELAKSALSDLVTTPQFQLNDGGDIARRGVSLVSEVDYLGGGGMDQSRGSSGMDFLEVGEMTNFTLLDTSDVDETF
ncbi:hypothetical protein PPROV_000947000 [Pycnococcus provasolii]|uniref:Peptidase S49 domain-containing protein n=1 Tax=Pycnococcus provasolii TaxID=41880 RepID=A0A830I109_9CHLO|nr:hypothetical protein PPROV_000947000 [Pycnococcus provasolii]